MGTVAKIIAILFWGEREKFIRTNKAKRKDRMELNQQGLIAQKLIDFDSYMEKLLQDWNAPGVAVGIVANDQLVFAQGYGYRDYEKKLPFTPKTLFPIGSNTKLFTSVAAGMLVEAGNWTLDKEQKQFA